MRTAKPADYCFTSSVSMTLGEQLKYLTCMIAYLVDEHVVHETKTTPRMLESKVFSQY